MHIMLPFTTLLLLTKIQKPFCSAGFLAQCSKLLKKFVHYGQVLKHNRNHYCFQCHQTWQRYHTKCGMNYGAWETLFQELREEWNRRETADKLIQWNNKKRILGPDCSDWLLVLTPWSLCDLGEVTLNSLGLFPPL